VKTLSGYPSSDKWFAVCSFETQICLSGENTKWLPQFR